MNLTKCILSLCVVVAISVATENTSAQEGTSPVEGAAQINGASQLEFELFQNFYTQPGASVNQAAMYNAPHPVPYWVGQTYYTYQPFYPHQHLYSHSKNYYNYYGNSPQFYSDCCNCGRGGDALNKTTVVWHSGANHWGHLPFSSFCLQKLGYNIHSRQYCLNCDRRR